MAVAIPAAGETGVDGTGRGVRTIELLVPPGYVELMAIRFDWRGDFATDEVNELHAEAFEHRAIDASEWDSRAIITAHSLGWVTARDDGRMVGFVNVPWDGLVHAWIQDTMVAKAARHQGIATQLVAVARDGASEAGCKWLHVDFDDQLKPLYLQSCGFTPTSAGLLALQP